MDEAQLRLLQGAGLHTLAVAAARSESVWTPRGECKTWLYDANALVRALDHVADMHRESL